MTHERDTIAPETRDYLTRRVALASHFRDGRTRKTAIPRDIVSEPGGAHRKRADR